VDLNSNQGQLKCLGLKERLDRYKI